jgi:hypothetical protein
VTDLATNSHSCPSCRAPLDDLPAKAPGSDLLFCLYCNSALRLNASAAGPTQPVLLSTPDPAVIAQARLDLIEKNQAAATRLLVEKGALDAGQAHHAARLLEEQMAIQSIYGRKLGSQGWSLALIVLLLALGSLAAGLAGQISLPISLGLSVAFLLLLFPFLSGIRTELRLRRAPSAPAVLQMYTQCGRFRELLTFRALLEVQPEGQAPFQAQTYLAARRQNLSYLHAGLRLLVRYFPSERDWVIFERTLEAVESAPPPQSRPQDGSSG